MWRLSDALPIDDDFDLDMGADLAIWFSSRERSLHPLKVLCRALPLQTIRTVHVSIDAFPFSHDILTRDWVEILGRCTEVNRAWVSNDQAISFCKALSMTTDAEPRSVVELDRKGRKQNRLFLGKLGALKLSNMDFRVRGEYLESNRVFHRLLIEWLSDRLEVDACPTLNIDLEECTVKKEWVEDLKRVANVKWDNDSGGYSSDSEEEGCYDCYEDSWY
ncbi:hypothetical protein EWM64_g1710 [Hericium alpestre]|uniref:Uncharacterized protein n=1 Tax=Hericium alpestre TaxID=135208 RepID=A0A4Z0A5K9_9AGAM|nr:hypothetical protein EWM64_g1710 [Hericium alpestre]